METIDKLQQVIGKFEIGMLITQDDAGMAGRPMSIAEHDEKSGVLLFSTSLNTEKVEEIEKHPDAAVVFQDGARYASLTGEAVISNDRRKIRELFNKSWELWFPEGPEQADIRLIEFTPVIGEYWDMSGTQGVRFLWKAGEALISGNRLQANDQIQHAETVI